MNKYEIQISPKAILEVPLQLYENDYIFLVNGKEFKTNRLCADLISPKISHIHLTDPTNNKFIINTFQKGNFLNVINLLNFQSNEIDESELPFISEVIEILGNNHIELKDKNQNEQISVKNVISLIKKHEKCSFFFIKQFEQEINFISSHFYELCETLINEYSTLKIDTLIKIIDNDQLQLESEDQLLSFVNKLNYNDSNLYSILYDFVNFINVSPSKMSEFVSIYNIDFMTKTTWSSLSDRLVKETINSQIELKYYHKYNKRLKIDFPFIDHNEFSGIFRYLGNISNGQIENEVKFSWSSLHPDHEKNAVHPKNVTLFNERKKIFSSAEERNSYICFDFKESRVIPSIYSIRTTEKDYFTTCYYPQSWKIEGSNDNKNWIELSRVNDCEQLHGPDKIHSFAINQNCSKEFQYIKMTLTKDWSTCNCYFIIDSFEIYGTLLVSKSYYNI